MTEFAEFKKNKMKNTPILLGVKKGKGRGENLKTLRCLDCKLALKVMGKEENQMLKCPNCDNTYSWEQLGIVSIFKGV